MDLQEAIIHAREVSMRTNLCSECAHEHGQIAVWLEELQHYRALDVEEVVHGKWLKTENGIRKNINTGEMVMAYIHDCSVCGWRTGNQGRNFNYCPNCGAKMEEEDDDS